MTQTNANNSSKSGGNNKPGATNGSTLLNLDPAKLSEKDLPWLIERLREQSHLINKQKMELSQFYQQEKLKPDPKTAVDDASPFGFLVLNNHGIILAVNQIICDWLGISKRDIVGKPMTIYIKPEDQVTFSWHRRLVLSTQAPQTCEFSLNKKGDGNKMYIRASSLLFSHSEEAAPQWQMLLKKIIEQKREPSGQIKKSAFETLIPELSKRLTIKIVTDIDAQIKRALEIIGEITSVDRSFMAFFDAEATQFDKALEWCKKDIMGHMAKFKGQKLAVLPWIENKIKRWETISIHDSNDLPDEAKLEKADMIVNDCRSILIMPLVFKKRLYGMIGLEAVSVKRKWAKDDKLLLMTAAIIIIHARERLETETELIKFREKNRLLNEKVNTAKDKIEAGENKCRQYEAALEKIKLKYQSVVEEMGAYQNTPSNTPRIQVDSGLYNLLFKEQGKQPKSIGEQPAIVLHDEEQLPQFWQFRKGIPSVLMRVYEASTDKKGNVQIKCPKCRLEKKLAYGIFKGHKYPIKVTCPCKYEFSVKLEMRRSKRRKIENRAMEGAYKDYTEINKWIKFAVIDISGTGIGFKVDHGHNIHEGQKMMIKYVNNDMARTLIQKEVYTRNVLGNYIGCEFVEPLSLSETVDMST